MPNYMSAISQSMPSHDQFCSALRNFNEGAATPFKTLENLGISVAAELGGYTVVKLISSNLAAKLLGQGICKQLGNLLVGTNLVYMGLFGASNLAEHHICETSEDDLIGRLGVTGQFLKDFVDHSGGTNEAQPQANFVGPQENPVNNQ